MQPQIFVRDARVFAHVKSNRQYQKHATMIKHVCHHSPCNLRCHGRTWSEWVSIVHGQHVLSREHSNVFLNTFGTGRLQSCSLLPNPSLCLLLTFDSMLRCERHATSNPCSNATMIKHVYHHSPCNLSFHGRTWSEWVSIVHGRHIQSRQYSMSF